MLRCCFLLWLVFVVVGCSAGVEIRSERPADTHDRSEQYSGRLLAFVAGASITKICLAGDEIFAGCLDGRILRIDSRTGRVLAQITAHTSGVIDIVRMDGAQFLTSGADGALVLTDFAAGLVVARYRLPAGEYGTALVRPSAEEPRVLVGTKGGGLYLLALPGFSLLSARSHDAPVWGLVMTGKDSCLAADGKGRVLQVSLDQDLKVSGTFDAHRISVEAVAFQRAAGVFATVSRDRLVKLWSLPLSLLPRHTMRGHADSVLTAAFSHDGGLLYTAGWDCAVYVWKVDSGELVDVIRAHTRPIQSIAAVPEGVLTSSLDGSIKIWKKKEKV